MAAASSAVRLKVGDTVSAAVGTFGKEYALQRGARPWTSELVRDESQVVGKDGSRWLVDFDDGEGPVGLARKALQFVRRPAEAEAGTTRASAICEEEDEDGATAEQPMEEFSDSEDSEDETAMLLPATQAGDAEHENGQVDGAADAEWRRDDAYGVDERVKHGATAKVGPILAHLPDWVKASLFKLGCHFLPLKFLQVLAESMEAMGKVKYEKGNKNYVNWRVTRDDVLQWIGVWLYMLAYPMLGDRSRYWEEPAEGFGPRHMLAKFLQKGRNGEKGRFWFERMQACLWLPMYPAQPSAPKDPFRPVRMLWDALRDGFLNAVEASWLLVLDESMVRWMGRGMPGLMVILRKPTPVGLEVHTLCCALSGILVHFEVYEGKEAMTQKQFNIGAATTVGQGYPKSIALTLRMMKPFFGSVRAHAMARNFLACLPRCAAACLQLPVSRVFIVCRVQARVLIADSWFGSVACALALFKHGIYAIMNVKTATKNFPKDALMMVVGEIKGTTAEAKAARKERRGATMAFTRDFDVGSRKVTLLAAGHNQKVPLLLVCTSGSMLPGAAHEKVWHTHDADGQPRYHRIVTPQPQAHALYRKWMNIVDIHNKLRQGSASMADTWATRSWVDRHFAEGIGFWEVNVFKALTYFYKEHEKMGHNEFRERLAFTFLTLGTEKFPRDKKPAETPMPRPSAMAASARSSQDGAPATVDTTPPLAGATHMYERLPGKRGRSCSYCDNKAYQFCIACAHRGLGTMFACGLQTKRTCMAMHAAGEPIKHANWEMNTPTREHSQAARIRARAEKNAEKEAEGGQGANEEEESGAQERPDAAAPAAASGARAQRRQRR